MFDLQKYKLIKTNEYSYVPETTDQWLELINDIAVDYDGCNAVESLKDLIDEMRAYSIFARMTLAEEVKKYKGITQLEE